MTKDQFYCEKCKKPFTSPKLKEKKTKDGGAKQWFNCPHCHEKYPVCIITRRGLELRARIQSYLKGSRDYQRSNAKRIASLQEDMRRETTRWTG